MFNFPYFKKWKCPNVWFLKRRKVFSEKDIIFDIFFVVLFMSHPWQRVKMANLRLFCTSRFCARARGKPFKWCCCRTLRTNLRLFLHFFLNFLNHMRWQVHYLHRVLFCPLALVHSEWWTWRTVSDIDNAIKPRGFGLDAEVINSSEFLVWRMLWIFLCIRTCPRT